MKTARDYNELLNEYDQLDRLIPMISEQHYDLALRTISRRLTDVSAELERVTDPNYRTIAQIFAEKKAQLLSQRNGN